MSRELKVSMHHYFNDLERTYCGVRDPAQKLHAVDVERTHSAYCSIECCCKARDKATQTKLTYGVAGTFVSTALLVPDVYDNVIQREKTL